MTRATLLHVLDRPTALGPAEVRELEQLALAFPYCQTAHLLLAKAAHDQGTMLAGQRLRRAATYAADRTLLRRLIEQVEPAAVPAEQAPTEPAPIVETLVAVPAPTALPESVSVAASLPAILPLLGPEPADAPAAEPARTIEAEVPALTAEDLTSDASILAPPAPVLATAPTVDHELAAPAPDMAPEPTVAADLEVLATEVPAAAVELPIVDEPLPAALVASEVPVSLPYLLEQEGAAIAAAEIPVDETLQQEAPIPAILAAVSIPEIVVPQEEEEEELPAQAPAIRPPVEAGEARFEFGLAEPPPPAAPTYELPGLVDEWAASAVTRSMGNPGAIPAAWTPVPNPVVFTPAAFTGDVTVGYAFGESSRLGLSMQLLDLLTTRAETAEGTSPVVAAAQPPAMALPPAGTFFEPDPLLLSHWATHCPPAPTLPSSLDLINNFLKRQPRLTRPAMLPPSPGTQADLSVRSTRAEPDLVSENLARIFIRQGKIARAVEIYEKLMVKQPEKMAYFTAQIQQLQPSA